MFIHLGTLPVLDRETDRRTNGNNKPPSRCACSA